MGHSRRAGTATDRNGQRPSCILLALQRQPKVWSMYAVISLEDICRRTRADGIVMDHVKRRRSPGVFIPIVALTLLLWQHIFLATSVDWAVLDVGQAQAATSEPVGAAKRTLPNLRLVDELQTPGLVSTVVWSSDGTKLAAGSLGGGFSPFNIQNPFGKIITIWDSLGHVVRQIQRETAFFAYDDTFAFISGDTQLVTPPVLSANGAFALFDVSTGEPAREVPGLHPGRPRNANGATVLVASPDQSFLAVQFGYAILQPVALYSTRSWNKLGDLWIRSPIAFSPDGKVLAGNGSVSGVSETNRHILVYDLDTNRIMREIDAFPDRTPAASAIAFSPDGGMIALGSSGTQGVDRSPDGRIKWVPLNNSNSPLRIFKVDNGALLASYGNSAAITSGLAWSPDGRFIAFVTGHRMLHIWNPFQIDNSERIIDLSATEGAGPIALSRDGTMLAVGVRQWVRVYQFVE
jgi:WD40 repeat protein